MRLGGAGVSGPKLGCKWPLEACRFEGQREQFAQLTDDNAALREALKWIAHIGSDLGRDTSAMLHEISEIADAAIKVSP